MAEEEVIVVLPDETGGAESNDVCVMCQHHTPQGDGTMAVPPTYNDLGKAAREIFDKGFGYGCLKLDLKTKTESGIEFSTSGTNTIDTGKTTGHLETKYFVERFGLNVNHKWLTDNTLNTELTMDDKPYTGVRLGMQGAFVPYTGKKNLKLKSGYKRENMNLGCDLEFDIGRPTVQANGVLSYEGWMGGYQLAFDTNKSQLIQKNFALGYKSADFELHTQVHEGTEFAGSIFQRLSSSLETAIHLAWTAGSNNSSFGIGAKYQLDKDASISTKVNNSCMVGFGYTQNLRPGVKLTLSAMVDGKNVHGSGHKVGIGFELEA